MGRKIYSVHVRTRKFRNPEKTKRYVVPAPRANSKTQGGTRIDSDSICHRCHRHQSVFFGFSDGLSIHGTCRDSFRLHIVAPEGKGRPAGAWSRIAVHRGRSSSTAMPPVY